MDPIHGEGQAQNLNEARAADRKKVNIHDVQELRYWTKTLGVSSDALVSAVRAVGHDSDKVMEHLRQLRAAS